jgi:hypothetical protein
MGLPRQPLVHPRVRLVLTNDGRALSPSRASAAANPWLRLMTANGFSPATWPPTPSSCRSPPIVSRLLGRQTDARWLIGAGLLVIAVSNYYTALSVKRIYWKILRELHPDEFASWLDFLALGFESTSRPVD